MRLLKLRSLRNPTAWLCGLGLLVGCTGQTALLGPRPPTNYTPSRTADGRACTFLVLGVIPSSNFQRRDQIAYERALSHGGRALTDTTIQYSWYVIPYVGYLHCTRITGKVIE